MSVQSRHQVLAILPHHAGRLDSCLVILKTDLGRQPGHADVITGFAVAVRVAQVDDVDVMVPAPLCGFHLITIRPTSNLYVSKLGATKARKSRRTLKGKLTQFTRTRASTDMPGRSRCSTS